MNKELKSYIKENLKKYKKRNSIIKILLFPMFFLKSFFSKAYKSILFEDELFYNEEKFNNEKSNSKQGKTLSKRKNICFDETNISDGKKDDINIEQYIKDNNKYNDFQTLLFKMIDEKNLIDSDVYNKVHIDRRLFSKIRNDKAYHPSKETIILLGLSMELSEIEIEKLLDSASYSLPRNNHYDLIIRFCFMKSIYKITEVNDLLEKYNCKLFNY